MTTKSCKTCKYADTQPHKDPCSVCITSSWCGGDMYGKYEPKWERLPEEPPVKPTNCLWILQENWGMYDLNFTDYEVFIDYEEAFERMEKLKKEGSLYTLDYQRFTINLYSPVKSRE